MLKRKLFRTFTIILAFFIVMGSIIPGTTFALTGTSDGLHGHDPSAIRVGDSTYVFSTGFVGGPGGGAITIHKTTDPTMYSGWTYVGAVWNTIPAWIPQVLGSTPKNIWGPDINFWDNKYWLYYAAAVDSAHIAVGLLTATNIEGPWTDEGQVVGPTEIDPHVVWDGSVPYLMWGGFSQTHIRRLDPTTGKYSSQFPTDTVIATGIENSTVLPYGGYYYLMGSNGLCCSNVNSTYKTVLGRATSITGPYLNAAGGAMTNSGGTIITYGVKAYTDEVGPGGADWFQVGSDYYFVHHYYNRANNGIETIGIRKFQFENGWLTISNHIDSTGSVTSNTPAGYVWAGYEGQSVNLGGTFDVAFGAQGSYSFKTGQTGTVTFNSTTFGGDPLPGQPKNAYIKTTDLALIKAVSATSSVENFGWFLTKAVNGGRNSVSGSMGWSSSNSLTTNHTESITVDLAETKSVSRVDLYPRNDSNMVGEAFPIDFTIQVSNDNTNWTTVVTQTNYAKPGNSVQSFNFTTQNARYIKVQGTNLRQVASDNNYYRMQLKEIEVY